MALSQPFCGGVTVGYEEEEWQGGWHCANTPARATYWLLLVCLHSANVLTASLSLSVSSSDSTVRRLDKHHHILLFTTMHTKQAPASYVLSSCSHYAMKMGSQILRLSRSWYLTDRYKFSFLFTSSLPGAGSLPWSPELQLHAGLRCGRLPQSAVAKLGGAGSAEYR